MSDPAAGDGNLRPEAREAVGLPPLNVNKAPEPDGVLGDVSYDPLDDPGAADGWLGTLEEVLGREVDEEVTPDA